MCMLYPYLMFVWICWFEYVGLNMLVWICWFEYVGLNMFVWICWFEYVGLNILIWIFWFEYFDLNLICNGYNIGWNYRMYLLYNTLFIHWQCLYYYICIYIYIYIFNHKFFRTMNLGIECQCQIRCSVDQIGYHGHCQHLDYTMLCQQLGNMVC